MPSVVLEDLAEHVGQTLFPQDREGLSALDNLPEPLRGALARFLEAFLDFFDLGAAIDRVDVAAPAVREAAWRPADPGPWAAVMQGRVRLLEATRALVEAVKVTGPVSVSLAVPQVVSMDLQGVDSVYTEDALVLLDVGGNDLYRNNAGGSRRPGAAALVDLAGNDAYVSQRGFGVNGGANLGAGFLFDQGGDDVYVADRDGVNGGGAVGLGFLLDAGGNDQYVAGYHAVNGGAGMGAGMLLDMAGNDYYSGLWRGVNGGSFHGSGMLVDRGAGRDRYLGDFWGVNGGTDTGTGVLYDEGGDDSYSANDLGVNGGVQTIRCIGGCVYLDAPGVGLLYDGGGTDGYSESRGSCQDCTMLLKGLAGFQLDGPLAGRSG